LAAVEGQRDPVDGTYGAAFGGEGGAQVLDRQQATLSDATVGL
jgi:hypothetical protein